MHLLLSMLQKIFLIKLCESSPSPLHRLVTQNFDERYKRKQSESFLSQPEHTIWISRHITLKKHLGLNQHLHFEKFQKFTFGCFSLKVLYNSCKVQRILQVEKLLIMYSFTHTNIVFLFRHLPTEIAIFINVCYQMKCFSGDSFSFF